jgi:hypothetical protein
MNRVMAALVPLIVLVLIPAAVSSEPVEDKFKTGNPVILTGYISTSMYMSRQDKSEKEYFNTAYILRLDRSIVIEDSGILNGLYRDIRHIEIEEPFKHGIHSLTGKKVTVRGILKTFSQRAGYYRQYSTPVKIELIEIVLTD